MAHVSQATQHCIDECLRCYQACFGSAMTHCLEQGGKHVEPQHFRLMMACAEICRTCAHLMLINYPHYKRVCRECAEICELCAQNCDRIGDMQECAEACRRCAERCSQIAAYE